MPKKKQKMDPKLVASKEKQEVNYIAKAHKIPVKKVREAVKKAGRSRAKVYTELRAMGYVIKTRKYS